MNKNMNKNVTHTNFSKQNQAVNQQQNTKMRQPNARRNTKQIVVITHANKTNLINSPEIRKKIGLFSAERLTHAFPNSQINRHLQFDNEQDKTVVMEKWSPIFLVSITAARYPGTQDTNHYTLFDKK